MAVYNPKHDRGIARNAQIQAEREAAQADQGGGAWGGVGVFGANYADKKRDSIAAQQAYGFSSPPPLQGSDNYAKDTYAWITRENYEDYQNRFLPHEQQLLDAVTGRQLLDERLSQININEHNAFQSTRGATQRRERRYGVLNDQRQDSANEVANHLARSSAVDSAQNQTRQAVQDRNMAMITGAPSQRQAIPENPL